MSQCDMLENREPTPPTFEKFDISRPFMASHLHIFGHTDALSPVDVTWSIHYVCTFTYLHTHTREEIPQLRSSKDGPKELK